MEANRNHTILQGIALFVCRILHFYTKFSWLVYININFAIKIHTSTIKPKEEKLKTKPN
jgi:hypothetical protein